MSESLTATVPLVNRNGEIAAISIIDAADADWVLKHRWGVQRTQYGRLYACRWIGDSGHRQVVPLHGSASV